MKREQLLINPAPFVPSPWHVLCVVIQDESAVIITPNNIPRPDAYLVVWAVGAELTSRFYTGDRIHVDQHAPGRGVHVSVNGSDVSCFLFHINEILGKFLD